MTPGERVPYKLELYQLLTSLNFSSQFNCLFSVALVQRMCSLPGYASTGDSAGSSSSADSGSESPNGSFSPGLELDENGRWTD